MTPGWRACQVEPGVWQCLHHDGREDTETFTADSSLDAWDREAELNHDDVDARLAAAVRNPRADWEDES